MERWVALLLGVIAWTLVAGVAVLVVHAWGDDNQVAGFFPIAAAVFIAAIIGEYVTAHVFGGRGGAS